VSVVHQYDRYPDLQQHLFHKVRLDMQSIVARSLLTQQVVAMLQYLHSTWTGSRRGTWRRSGRTSRPVRRTATRRTATCSKVRQRLHRTSAPSLHHVHCGSPSLSHYTCKQTKCSCVRPENEGRGDCGSGVLRGVRPSQGPGLPGLHLLLRRMLPQELRRGRWLGPRGGCEAPPGGGLGLPQVVGDVMTHQPLVNYSPGFQQSQ